MYDLKLMITQKQKIIMKEIDKSLNKNMYQTYNTNCNSISCK